MTRSMDSTSRGAFSRFYSDKGRVLSEEEQAKENVYIQVLPFHSFLINPYHYSDGFDVPVLFVVCARRNGREKGWRNRRLRRPRPRRTRTLLIRYTTNPSFVSSCRVDFHSIARNILRRSDKNRFLRIFRVIKRDLWSVDACVNHAIRERTF